MIFRMDYVRSDFESQNISRVPYMVKLCFTQIYIIIYIQMTICRLLSVVMLCKFWDGLEAFVLNFIGRNLSLDTCRLSNVEA
jgi:hypothetical protein